MNYQKIASNRLHTMSHSYWPNDPKGYDLWSCPVIRSSSLMNGNPKFNSVQMFRG